VKDFSARVDFDDGGEGKHGYKTDQDGGGAVDAQEEAGICLPEENVSDVFCWGKDWNVVCVDSWGKRDPPV
jgi:hypothetical protein